MGFAERLKTSKNLNTPDDVNQKLFKNQGLKNYMRCAYKRIRYKFPRIAASYDRRRGVDQNAIGIPSEHTVNERFRFWSDIEMIFDDFRASIQGHISAAHLLSHKTK